MLARTKQKEEKTKYHDRNSSNICASSSVRHSPNSLLSTLRSYEPVEPSVRIAQNLFLIEQMITDYSDKLVQENEESD